MRVRSYQGDQMSHGLMPTQMEEYQRKHRIRFFVEGRILEVRDIILHIADILYRCYNSIRSVHAFMAKNWRFMVKVLIAALVLTIFMV
jgi:hypothetical protein